MNQIKTTWQKKETKPAVMLNMGFVPPQAVEFEEAVIGAILIEKETLAEVMAILPDEQPFYIDAHQKVYKAIISLANQSKPVDLLTVVEKLGESGELEIVGGAYFITRLTMSVLTGAHAEHHALIIREKYMARELIRVSSETISALYHNEDIFTVIDAHQAEISTITDAPGINQAQPIFRSANDVMREIKEIRESGDLFTGITTGYPSMNDQMNGWQAPDLTIIAARPAVGKTAFALNLAFNAVKDNDRLPKEKKVSVCIFSLEMGAMQVSKRAFAFMAHVRLEEINRPTTLTDSGMLSLDSGLLALTKSGVFIDDAAVITVNQAKNKARRLKMKHGGRWLFIFDYLQLITPANPKAIREQQVSSISRDLKLMAKELNESVIALSQLNRNGDEYDEPGLKDLRESGAIEQDADNVMFLYKVKEDYGKVILKGAKFRNGQPFMMPMAFNKDYQLFSEPETVFRSANTPNPHAGMPTALPSKMFVPSGFQDYTEPYKEDGPF